MSPTRALSLLLPSWQQTAEHKSASTLNRWLDRGDRLATAQSGRDSSLRGGFQFIGTAIPAAALTRSLDANDADSALWLRADPAFVMADAVTLRLLACGHMGLSASESEAFAQVLRPLFGDAGFPLEATRSDRWYLRCPRESRLPTFSSPDEALGDDLALHLPSGDEARRWRGLLNEAQMMLNQHPLNSERMRRGLPDVNSLWFWGAGLLPEWVRTNYTQVFSNDDIVIALAKLAKVSALGKVTDFDDDIAQSLGRTSSPASDVDTKRDGEGSASILIDLAAERDIDMLEARWFAPIDAAVAQRKVDTLHLLFLSGERVTVKRSHRWRFWRRAKKPVT